MRFDLHGRDRRGRGKDRADFAGPGGGGGRGGFRGRRGGFGGPFGGSSGDWDGEGGPRGRVFASGELRLFLLHLLAGADRHGYELIKAVEELTGGAYAPSPGVVYPTLSLLVDEGLIAEVPGEGARRAFTLTEAGRAEIAARAEAIGTIAARLAGLAAAQGRGRNPVLARAMANLHLAVRNRARQGDSPADITHQIADILDEAARRIERL